MAMEAGICPIQLETDSMRAFNLLIREEEDLSRTGLIINLVKSNFSDILHASYIFIKRDENVVAHLLAQRALLRQE